MNESLFQKFSELKLSIEVYYIIKKILPQLINKEAKILELGVDNGGISNLLSENYKVHCIDIAKECLDKLNHRIKNKIILDLDNRSLKLPFNDNSFACVLAFKILEHIKHFEILIKEIKRIIKTDNFITKSTPNINWIPFRIKFLMGMHPKDFHATHHMHFWNLRRLRKIFKDNDFKILKQICLLGLLNLFFPFIKKYRGKYFKIYDKYIFIASSLKTNLLGYNQVIIVQK